MRVPPVTKMRVMIRIDIKRLFDEIDNSDIRTSEM